MKIEELKINDNDKRALRELAEPKTIAEVAVLLGSSYSTAFMKLKVWEASGWVKRLQQKRIVRYFLDQDEVQTNSAQLNNNEQDRKEEDNPKSNDKDEINYQ